MTDDGTAAKRPKRTAETQDVAVHCGHWVKRKKRFCKMTVAKNQSYCGEHLPAVEQVHKAGDAATNERVPCPLDGKHTVYKNKLEKHLKICNARPKLDEPDYIEKGINCGEALAVSHADYGSLKLGELSDEEFYGAVDVVKRLYQEYVEGRIETLQVQHESLDEELANETYGKEAKKHLIQAAALLGILESEGQLQSSTSYIEFGAGKGQLAFFLAGIIQSMENSQVVLLDRMSLRHKKDNKIEDKTLVHRIRADIADFRMSKLDLLKKTERKVAVSKHLCGGATDLTLRCITAESPATTEFVMIALCCHHRCDWRSFVGKEFFREAQVTPRQFAIVTKMVSWAICGTGMSRERRRELEEQSVEAQQAVADSKSTTPLRLSLAERERVGLMCKRVLDHARLGYLRQHGYEASLKYYVSRDVTLENVCLIARKL